MPKTVRRCTSCGREDAREVWPSMDAAASAGVLASPWTCPACGHPEGELADRSEAASGEELPAPPLNANLAELPDDPDERRRAVETILPMDHP